jgi:hypothetical protein
MSGFTPGVGTNSGILQDGPFPVGTKMLFNQTASPTGWTKVTGSGNDTALRVTTGTVGTGGSVAFETAFASQSTTPTITQPTASSGSVSGHAITESELDNHSHQVQDVNAVWVSPGAGGQKLGGDYPQTYVQTGLTGGNNPHTHGFTQPTISQPTSSAITFNLDVSYVDVIIATKD